MSELLLDAAGRRRSPATLPQFHAGRPPRNEGISYPADPPTVEEIVAVMRHAGDRAPRAPAARVDRRALARWFADSRGARARRSRPGSAARIAARAHQASRLPNRGQPPGVPAAAGRAAARRDGPWHGDRASCRRSNRRSMTSWDRAGVTPSERTRGAAAGNDVPKQQIVAIAPWWRDAPAVEIDAVALAGPRAPRGTPRRHQPRHLRLTAIAPNSAPGSHSRGMRQRRSTA
jgi:hypothetical protein